MNKKIIKALNNEKEFIKEVLVKPSSPIDRVLFFLGLRRKKKSIELSGLVNAIVYKVASLFAEMSINENSKEAIQQQIYVAMRDNLPLLIDALAYAIHNKQGQPPKWIYDALEYQFTS